MIYKSVTIHTIPLTICGITVGTELFKMKFEKSMIGMTKFDRILKHCYSSSLNTKLRFKRFQKGPFTPQIILAVVWSCCGSLEQIQLTCFVLLVVEVTKQFPGPGLAGSCLTKT